MKKIIMLLVSIMLITGCSSKPNEVVSEIVDTSVSLLIIDKTEDKVLFDDVVSVEGSELVLADLLDLCADKLMYEKDKGTYGTQVVGLMGVNTSDWNVGPWWMYESENNADCVALGYCMGVDEVKISDGDIFTFTFTSDF